jgi:hypothetical protein
MNVSVVAGIALGSLVVRTMGGDDLARSGRHIGSD